MLPAKIIILGNFHSYFCTWYENSHVSQCFQSLSQENKKIIIILDYFHVYVIHLSGYVVHRRLIFFHFFLEALTTYSLIPIISTLSIISTLFRKLETILLQVPCNLKKELFHKNSALSYYKYPSQKSHYKTYLRLK